MLWTVFRNVELGAAPVVCRCGGRILESSRGLPLPRPVANVCRASRCRGRSKARASRGLVRPSAGYVLAAEPGPLAQPPDAQIYQRCTRQAGTRGIDRDRTRRRATHPGPREPTARAITNSEVISAAVACIPIRIFARLVNGIVSVGLNALEFVVDRNR